MYQGENEDHSVASSSAQINSQPQTSPYAKELSEESIPPTLPHSPLVSKTAYLHTGGENVARTLASHSRSRDKKKKRKVPGEVTPDEESEDENVGVGRVTVTEVGDKSTLESKRAKSPITRRGRSHGHAGTHDAMDSVSSVEDASSRQWSTTRTPPRTRLGKLRTGFLELSRSSIAMTLENSGSVARDHLALERTFLAYVRTSLAIASTGVGLVQLFTISLNNSGGSREESHIQKFARPLGATTVVLGITVLFIGVSRFFRVQSLLVNGLFPAGNVAMIFIATGLGLLVVTVFGVLVSVPR